MIRWFRSRIRSTTGYYLTSLRDEWQEAFAEFQPDLLSAVSLIRMSGRVIGHSDRQFSFPQITNCRRGSHRRPESGIMTAPIGPRGITSC